MTMFTHADPPRRELTEKALMELKAAGRGPTCRVCRLALGPGDWVDNYWPWEGTNNAHKHCAEGRTDPPPARGTATAPPSPEATAAAERVEKLLASVTNDALLGLRRDTLRELYAGHALGALARHPVAKVTAEEIALTCVRLADEVLVALGYPRPPEPGRPATERAQAHTHTDSPANP